MTRRAWLLGASLGIGALAGRSCLQPTSDPGPPFPPVDPSASAGGGIMLNDASQMSPTRVASHVSLDTPPKLAVEHVRRALSEARAAGRPFIASCARHSMGGQSLTTDGTVVTLNQHWLEADSGRHAYRVAAGARWSTVIAELDRIGCSPAVMQSNNDFGVGGTFSVNAHGWAVPRSGCGSTVKAVTMVLADGSVVRCSRDENADLFRHAMGGYGLFGVALELELEMVPNVVLTPRVQTTSGRELGAQFVRELVTDRTIQMAYGRMDVSLDRFLEQALLVTYRPSADQSRIPSASGSGLVSHASRYIFRGQLGSDRAKHFRWWSESSLKPSLIGEATRNSLLNEPVSTLDAHDPARTDILHEYFVPADRFGAFVAACQDVVPSSYQQLLNVTVRYVDDDRDSVLAYAPERRLAAVFLFSQEKSARAEADMTRMTRNLIDRVIDLGGSYYLPYRPHATLDQLVRGYPSAAAFAAKKRESDRDLVFRNQLWERYFAKL